MKIHSRIVLAWTATMCLILAGAASFAGNAIAQTTNNAVTADQVKGIFDAYAMVIMFAYGVAHKYIPALESWRNDLIPWVNVAGYILIKLGGVGIAHAGTGDLAVAVPSAIGIVVAAVSNSTATSLFYDKFGAPLLGWLINFVSKRKK